MIIGPLSVAALSIAAWFAIGLILTLAEKHIFWNVRWNGPFAVACVVRLLRGLYIMLPIPAIATLAFLFQKVDAAVWILLGAPAYLVLLHVYGYGRARYLKKKRYSHYWIDLFGRKGTQTSLSPLLLLLLLLFSFVGLLIILAIVIAGRSNRGRPGRSIEFEDTPLLAEIKHLLNYTGFHPSEVYLWSRPRGKYFSTRTPLLAWIPRHFQPRRSSPVQIPLHPFQTLEPNAIVAGTAYQLASIARPNSFAVKIGGTGFTSGLGCLAIVVFFLFMGGGFLVADVFGFLSNSSPLLIAVICATALLLSGLCARLVGLLRFPIDYAADAYAAWTELFHNITADSYAEALSEWLAYSEDVKDMPTMRHQLLLRLGFRRFARKHAPHLFQTWKSHPTAVQTVI